MKIAKIDYRLAKAPNLFIDSLKETGFAVITNHPIEDRLLASVYSEWAHFFNSSTKFGYKFNPETHAGYFPFKSENAKDSLVKDLKEFYHIYGNQDIPGNILQGSTIELRNQLLTMAKKLLHWVDEYSPYYVGNSLPESFMDMIEGSNQTLFRILHYPPLTEEVEPGAVRAAAHEDINLLTLLPAATHPGLEVLGADGNWYAVDCDPGNIIVNVGDMLQLASDGYYKSTTHRVVNPVGDAALESRYSMPLFLHPRPETYLSPTKTAGEYLNERLRELGLK